MSCFKWRTPASTFCSGSNGLFTFNCRAVEGISCISPIAPLRETALGLKLDSTFTTARTRLGSTLCRAAACSMAASTSNDEVDRPPKFDSIIFALADWLDSCPRYWLTSAAADRAAFITAALAPGTAFQRLSFELQYMSERRGVLGPASAGAGAAVGASFT